MIFLAVGVFAETDTSGQHDDFIEAVFFVALKVFEGKQASADEGLAELVAEVGGAVGGFDKNFLRCLVEPFTGGKFFFPWSSSIQAGIGRDVYCGACQRKG